MTSSIARMAVTLIVVVALVGAVGLVGAEMDTTSDESEGTGVGEMAGHVDGDVADHMDEDAIRMMQEHVSDHPHGEHHDGDAGHC